MILAINGITNKPVTAPPVVEDPELLNGFSRLALPPSIYSSNDAKVYRQIANHGTVINIQTITGDVTILTKYRNLLPIGGYGCDMILSLNVEGWDTVDLYVIDNNQLLTYADNGSGGGADGGVLNLNTWYGLKRVGNNIKAVSTLDGITYTTIADFGNRVGYNYLQFWGYDGGVGGATISNPQIKLG